VIGLSRETRWKFREQHESDVGINATEACTLLGLRSKETYVARSGGRLIG